MIVSTTRALLALVIIFCSAHTAFGQARYYDVWHFADRIGLDFRSGSPLPITGSMSAPEGCASICDLATGALLFYTDGITVWNRNHQVMVNGTGLFGHPSTTQAALIVPYPRDENRYYIFTLDARTSLSQSGLGLNYSLVDMRGNGGLGELVEKNTRLLSTASEKLVGVRHRSGCGYWILTHEVTGDRYYAWALTEDGLKMEPVISAVGHRYDILNRREPFDAGTLKASPDGTMLFASRGRPAANDPYFVESDSGDLCRFDAETGVVGPVIARLRSRYDACFSPNNRLLYTAVYDSLLQYDVDDLRNGRLNNATLIAGLSNYVRTFWGMQLGPDGRLYLVDAPRFRVPMIRHRLSVVDNPDVRGIGAGFRVFPLQDSARVTGGGLPNCIDGFLGESGIVNPVDIALPNDTVICSGGSVRLVASEGKVYRWKPTSGLSCADCSNPVATPQATTTYYVTAISAGGCESRDSVQVIVYPGVTVAAGADRVICPGDTVQLAATGGVRWKWEPADGLNCTDCPNPIASPETTTTYRVTAWSAEGCEASDEVEVILHEEPEIVRLRIGREYRGGTGEPIVIGVEFVDTVNATNIAELELELRYDPRVMMIDIESIERLLVGTALEGWSVEIRENVQGRLVLHFIAPAGTTLSGNKDLLRFEGRLYLSNVRGTELPFTMSSSSECFVFETEPGYAQVDSICGVNLRLIELTVEKYVPPVVYPNPARERVTFEFGLGLGGPTRLEVFDVLGNRVGVIVDEMLEPGGYVVEWDVRDVASGIYWYRLMSGDWSEGGEVLIRG